MKNERGQMIVLFSFLLPFLLVMLLVIVDLCHAVHAKIRLQGAVDRAVYAGTSHLAYRLNEITKLNHQVNDLFLQLKNDFENDTKGTEEEGNKHFHEVEKVQQDKYEEMWKINDDGYLAACQIAQTMMWQSEAADFLPLNSVSDNCSEALPMAGMFPEDRSRILFGEMPGNDMEPDGSGVGHAVMAVPNFLKDADNEVRFGGVGIKVIKRLFGKPLILTAYASGMPIRGNIAAYDSTFEPLLVRVRNLPPLEVQYARDHCVSNWCAMWGGLDVSTIQY